jgi:hypothetical protein
MRHEEDWWIGGWLIGLIIGLILGFSYTRLIPQPITPDRLTQTDKELYTVLIAAAYRNDNDLAKAQRRLDRLKDRNIGQTIVDLTETYIAAGVDVRDIRSLAALAVGLGQSAGFMQVYLLTPTTTPGPTPTTLPTSSPTSTSTNTPTPVPTATATATTTATATAAASVRPTITPRPTVTAPVNPGFQLAQSIALCDNSANGVLRVYVRDGAGNGIPGAEITVSWSGGQDRFYTGLKSELDAGFADFQMTRGQLYRVELNSEPVVAATEVNQAAATRCPDMPDDTLPSWQIVFQEGGEE